MFRLWGKIYHNNKIIADHVFELETPDLSLEDKTSQGLEALCYVFDLQKPMWLSDNTNDFKLISSTRFMAHHFIEAVEFDYLEIEVIENRDPA